MQQESKNLIRFQGLFITRFIRNNRYYHQQTIHINKIIPNISFKGVENSKVLLLISQIIS